MNKLNFVIYHEDELLILNFFDYLYKENLKKFLENENLMIEKENLRRKNYMKQINLKEFLDFKKEIEKNKMKLEEEQIIKTKKLKELWNERSKLIPNYIFL